MPIFLEIVLLVIFAILIFLLSIIIERKTSNYLSPKYGIFTYIIIAAVASYYLIDALLSTANGAAIRYIILWFCVMAGELRLFCLKNANEKKSNTA